MSTTSVQDNIDIGESYLIQDLFPGPTADTLFESLLREVSWQHMYHVSGPVPRLVACQGEINPMTGSMPVYRHPSDHTLPLMHWTPSVLTVKKTVEKKIGHGVNHVLIQLYRGGQDFISEHSDKTLDIARESKIVNVSFGAQRTLRLRSKRDPAGSEAGRKTQQIQLSHNSMFVMCLDTNRAFLHSIRADKRREAERSPAELAFRGMRISLTFRLCATFTSRDESRIWGQGAVSKSEQTARQTISGDRTAGEALIRAFALENQLSSGFDWAVAYGSGFDVLHLVNPVEHEKPVLVVP